MKSYKHKLVFNVVYPMLIKYMYNPSKLLKETLCQNPNSGRNGFMTIASKRQYPLKLCILNPTLVNYNKRPSWYKQIAAIVVLFFIQLFSYSQNINFNPSLTSITPPSPSASALGKFADIPVNYSAGLPSISVPIYQYKSGNDELSLNISLDYHAGGTKVDEIASNIGLGWALNAGGAISRTVVGIPDEVPMVGFMFQPNLPSTVQVYPDDPLIVAAGNVYLGNADGANDIFSYNFNGRTGKFILGKNNDFLLLTSEKIIVEKEIGEVAGMFNSASNHRLKKFIVTDENNIRYYFEAVEITSKGGCPNNLCTFPSTWYLTKVMDQSGETIVLTYEDVTIAPYTSSISKTAIELVIDPPPPNASALALYPGGASNTSTQSQSIKGKRLSQIQYPNGVTVSFTYDVNQRTDLPGDYLLKKIRIAGSSKYRGFNLYHDYSLNRATLKRVVPFDGANTEYPGHSFEYTGSLPSRLSPEQDHWGLYNTNPSNEWLPDEYIYSSVHNSFYNKDSRLYYHLIGGNRNVDPMRAKSGSLNKWTNPTGGYTVFEMESNTAVDARLKPKYWIEVDPSQVKILPPLYISSVQGSQVFSFNGDPNTNTPFTISIPNYLVTSGTTGYVELIIKNGSGVIIRTENVPLSNGAYSKTYSFTHASLQAGSYTLYYKGINATFSNPVTLKYTEIHAKVPTEKEQDLGFVGGLRVKSIKQYDGIKVDPVLYREFQYLKEDNVTSSGTIGIFPRYSFMAQFLFVPEETAYSVISCPTCEVSKDGTKGRHAVRFSSPVISLSSIHGSPVVYSRVVEIFASGSNETNGKIIREYTSFYDLPAQLDPNASFLPYIPPSYHDWKYGLLTKETVYDKNNIILRQTINQYDTKILGTSANENFRCIATYPFQYKFLSQSLAPPGQSPPLNPFATHGDWSIATPLSFGIQSYHPVYGRSDLTKVTTTEYTSGGNITNEINYSYDPTYFNLKSKSFVNSQGELVEEKYYYSFDYSASGAVSQMKLRNIIYPIVSAEKWKTVNGIKYLSGSIINNYSDLLSGIRLSSTYSFQSSSPVPSSSVPAFNSTIINRLPAMIKPYLEYSGYNNKGSITEASKSDDTKTAYFYGYNSQYLVAKVVGAEYNTAKQFIDQSLLDNLNTTDAQMRTELNKLRVNLPGALVYTFTYSPINGITSETTPNGRTTFYEYDQSGRLNLIRDHNNNILKRFCYYYNGQTSPCSL